MTGDAAPFAGASCFNNTSTRTASQAKVFIVSPIRSTGSKAARVGKALARTGREAVERSWFNQEQSRAEIVLDLAIPGNYHHDIHPFRQLVDSIADVEASGSGSIRIVLECGSLKRASPARW
jgi:hypothetical protein